MNYTTFAKRLEMSRSNTSGLFTRSDLYIKQVYRIGKVLKFNYFEYFDDLITGTVPPDAKAETVNLTELQRELSVAKQKVTELQTTVDNQNKIIELQERLLGQNSGNNPAAKG